MCGRREGNQWEQKRILVGSRMSIDHTTGRTQSWRNSSMFAHTNTLTHTNTVRSNINSSGPSIVPVWKCCLPAISACDFAWHIPGMEQPVLTVCGVVPMATLVPAFPPVNRSAYGRYTSAATEEPILYYWSAAGRATADSTELISSATYCPSFRAASCPFLYSTLHAMSYRYMPRP